MANTLTGRLGPDMEPGLFGRLSLMMFLEFFVWGAWYVTAPNYLTTLGMDHLIWWVYLVSPIAAIISPFFLGMVADRFFPTEKVLGTLHIISGIFLAISPTLAEMGTAAAGTLFVLALGVHMLCYMPTIGLANSMSFHNMSNQEQQFPYIRVSGTIGWIVAGLIVSSWLGADTTATPFYVAALASFLLGMYSFSLPHVPPPAEGEDVSVREVLGLDALQQLGSFSFNTFLVASLLICIPLAAYYAYAPVFVNAAGFANTAGWMTLGQASEAIFILLMPALFIFLGVKWMLAVGMFAWVLRYVLFGVAAPGTTEWMILTGIALHGICYDFFFVAGQIYVDTKATPAIRGQGQGLIVLITYGVGMFIGTIISGRLFDWVGLEGAALPEVMGTWQIFWFIPAALAFAVLLGFILLFHEEVEAEEAAEAAGLET